MGLSREIQGLGVRLFPDFTPKLLVAWIRLFAQDS